jgi:transcriptional regulator GlxA family with amidase domain
MWESRTVTTIQVPIELLPHLRRARDVADRNYAESLDLAGLAAAAGVSKYHFLRCFAAEYGETPMQYVARRRIERATDLLRATNLTVTEVCTLVGYSSLGSFSQRFTDLVGMSPSQYQRTHSGARIPGCFVFMLGLNSAIPEKQPGLGNAYGRTVSSDEEEP